MITFFYFLNDQHGEIKSQPAGLGSHLIWSIIWSICRQQIFCCLRAHQYSSDQMKVLKDQSAQTTARVVSVTYRLWLAFLINRVLNLTMLRSIIFGQSVDNSCFALWELISTSQIKWRSSRAIVLKLLLELWVLHITCDYHFWSTECLT